MRQTRVALSNLPVLMRDILAQVLSNCEDLEVVVCNDGLGLEEAVATAPDVIVVGSSADESRRIAGELAQASPDSRVIVIESNGISARTFDEARTEGVLLQPTVEGIIEAIRKPPAN